MVQVRSRLIATAAVLAAVALALFGGARGGIQAQDATPMAGMAMAGIPNHIHQGTCANLSGTIVAQLADATFTGQGAAASPVAGALATPVAGAMASPVAAMMGTAIPVAVASTSVPLALQQILAAPHAINFHDPAAPADPSRYLACGDIAGTPDAQGNLFVGLGELNNLGFSGVAWLLDDGTGATTVTVFLSQGQNAG